MTERAALLANVLTDPADDTARLVLADWLEEHGEEDFGRFVRAGVLAAQFRGQDRLDDPAYDDLLRTLGEVTRTGLPARWLADLGIGPSPLTSAGWVWDNTADRVTVRIGASAGVFARGLLAGLEVKLDEWYALAPAALAAWPVEQARIAEVPGLAFLVGPVPGGWRLTGRVRVPVRQVRLGGHVLPSAVGPAPVLAEGDGEWAADQFFPDRDALVGGVTRESAAIVDDLKDAAGDRWPRPPRSRR